MLAPETVRPAIRPLFIAWRSNGGGLSYGDFVTLRIQEGREEAKKCDNCGNEWEYFCDKCEAAICDDCDKGGARSLHDFYEGCICESCKDFNVYDYWDDHEF